MQLVIQIVFLIYLGPLVVILDIQKTNTIDETVNIPFWGLALGAVSFGVGILLLGVRTIKTVGSNLTELDAMKSFSTQVGAGIAVLLPSMFGKPVSTSHCLVGSLLGAAIADKCAGSKEAQINVSVLKKIIYGWVITIPLAMAAAVYFYCAIKGSLWEY